MKEYYKIGEISHLYGIGADSLRYYEEIGILKPKRDSNGYRMYSISDIRTLNILRELRSLGFSMQEIKDHLNDFDLEKTISLFRQEIEVIDKKVNELTSLHAQLSARIENLCGHLTETAASGLAEIVTLPPRKILKLSKDVYRDEDLDFIIKKLQRKNEQRLYIIGNGDMGATIPLNEIQNGAYGHFTSVFSITSGAEDFDDVIGRGSYLSMDVKGSYDGIPGAWKDLFAELKRRDLTAGADPLELYLIDNHDTADESEYLTRLQIPLK